MCLPYSKLTTSVGIEPRHFPKFFLLILFMFISKCPINIALMSLQSFLFSFFMFPPL